MALSLTRQFARDEAEDCPAPGAGPEPMTKASAIGCECAIGENTVKPARIRRAVSVQASRHAASCPCG